MPKHAARMMIAIVGAIALLALYSNVQKLRRDKIEKVTFTPAVSPAATPSPSPQ